MSPGKHLGPEFDDSDDFDPDFEEIDEVERDALHQDLLDVKTLKAVLGSRGVKGVVVFCPDCDSDHFLGWDLLAGNLQSIIAAGKPPIHEPAWEPDPDEYVSWDYARGFLDGYETYPEERLGGSTCGFCGSGLPEGGYEWAFCPSCGKDLAPINLIYRLKKKGWTSGQIAELMEQSGFDPPLFESATTIVSIDDPIETSIIDSALADLEVSLETPDDPLRPEKKPEKPEKKPGQKDE